MADSISDLKNTPTNPGTVEVLGYFNPGDGGGGSFYWDGDENKQKPNPSWNIVFSRRSLRLRRFFFHLSTFICEISGIIYSIALKKKLAQAPDII